MGIKTAYKGYKAYSYLEPGKDYQDFEFAPWNWAGEYLIPLDEAQEKRVKRLAKEKIFIACYSGLPCFAGWPFLCLLAHYDFTLTLPILPTF
jgi:hypothetical protein